MHKVLVDPGSAADLLQLPAFRQMNISLDRLSSAGRILSDFNGATTVTMGDITLLIRAGPVVQQGLFSVVEYLGTYYDASFPGGPVDHHKPVENLCVSYHETHT